MDNGLERTRTELLPCPFCGAQPERVYKSTGQTTHIKCPGCRAQFPKSTCANKYDDAWNARAATTIGKVQVEIEPIAATLGCEVNGDHEIPEYDFEAWNTRAERTCEIEKGTVGTAGWWVCKSCGTPFDMIGALACTEKKKPNYCPGCGRKVVSE